MVTFQRLVIAVRVLVSVLDGFDMQVMASTWNDVTRQRGLICSKLGLLLAAGFGMVAGPLLMTPMAKRIGRPTLVLGRLVLATVWTLLPSASQPATLPGFLSPLTALDIGGILTSNTVIAGATCRGAGTA